MGSTFMALLNNPDIATIYKNYNITDVIQVLEDIHAGANACGIDGTNSYRTTSAFIQGIIAGEQLHKLLLCGGEE